MEIIELLFLKIFTSWSNNIPPSVETDVTKLRKTKAIVKILSTKKINKHGGKFKMKVKTKQNDEETKNFRKVDRFLPLAPLCFSHQSRNLTKEF